VTGARDPGAWARLIVLGMIWGASFIATEIALEGFRPLSLAAGRIAVAALTLAALAHALGRGLPRWRGPQGPRIWGFALAIALLTSAVPFSLLSWAQTHVGAGLAAVFMALLPLMVLPLSHFLLPGEAMTARKLFGFALGSLGVALLIGPQALEGLGGAGPQLLAEVACLVAVFFYACGSLAAKKAPKVDPVSFGAAALSLSALIVVPLALIFDRPWTLPAPGWGAVGAVAALGLLPTAAAQVLLLQILSRAGPPFLSLVNFMVPVWALIFAVALLGETVAPRAGVALALIFAGVAHSQGLFARQGVAT